MNGGDVDDGGRRSAGSQTDTNSDIPAWLGAETRRNLSRRSTAIPRTGQPISVRDMVIVRGPSGVARL